MIKRYLALLTKFIKFVYPYRFLWLRAAILSVAASLIALINPYLFKIIIDEAIAGKDIRKFIYIALTAGFLFSLAALATGIAELVNKRLKLNVRFDLQKEVFARLKSFNLLWFKEHTSGEHVFKLDDDAVNAADFLVQALPQALYLLIMLLATLVILFKLSPELAVFSLCLAPLFYLPLFYFGKKLQEYYSLLAERSQGIVSFLEEFFWNIPVVKAFGREEAAQKRFEARLIAKNKDEAKTIKLETVSNLLGSLVNKICLGLILFYGTYKVINGQLTMGALTAIAVYLIQLMNSFRQFASFFEVSLVGVLSCRRLEAVFDQPLERDEPEATGFIFSRCGIEFKSLSFAYQPHNYILKNISFILPDSGGHFAIAGPSGCGKTTLLHLLLGLYQPAAGGIFIDGRDLRTIKRASLLSQVGFAMQEPFLWNTTISENISYGSDSSDRPDIIQAARLAGADDFISRLENGYEVVIGENASKISQGQKQRIAIARALFKKPRILILDEALSSLDSASENEILLGIKKLYPEMVLITVSHRLSAAVLADRVYFLTGPDTITSGTAPELLENNSEFKSLFAGQDKG